MCHLAYQPATASALMICTCSTWELHPKPTPANGKPASRQSLFHRVRYHYLGNAEGSTLRLTLGCLLSERLEIRLHKWAAESD